MHYTLCILAIAADGPEGEEEGEGEKVKEGMEEVGDGAALDVDATEGLNEVAHRVEQGEPLGPFGHGADGGEQTGEEDEDDEEEVHGQGCLLGVAAIVADDETCGRDQEAVEADEEEEQREAAQGHEAPDATGSGQPQQRHKQTHHPVGNELGKDELELADRRDVDLFDGTPLLLAYDIERRKEAYDEGEDQGEDGGYHVEAIVEVRIEAEERMQHGHSGWGEAPLGQEV